MILYVLVFLAWNLLVFSLYGIDKRRARQHRYRIPEFVLLTMTVFLGGPGALIGMYTFHHKTRKWYFVLIAWLTTLFLLTYLSRLFVGSSPRG